MVAKVASPASNANPTVRNKPGADSSDPEQIAWLNKCVTEKTAAAVLAAEKAGKPLAPEFAAALREKTALTSGFPVYEDRFTSVFYIAFVASSILSLTSISTFGPAYALGSAVWALFVYDILSGLLHIVFDHPGNISIPVLGQPCLEFQWHHHLPNDIIDKRFAQVCGDLNTVVGISLVGITVLQWIRPFKHPMLLATILAMIILFAYFGQFSHRSSHNRNPGKVVKILQSLGLMISNRGHRVHHTEPHDTNFCLIGYNNKWMNWVTRVLPHNDYPNFWLAVFATYLVTFVPITYYAHSALLFPTN